MALLPKDADHWRGPAASERRMKAEPNGRLSFAASWGLASSPALTITEALFIPLQAHEPSLEPGWEESTAKIT